MNDSAFDGLTRSIGTHVSRRRVLTFVGGAIGGGILILFGWNGTAAHDRTCKKFILSSGPTSSEPIEIDDNLFVYVNGKKVFGDRLAGVLPPITFRAKVGDKLKIVAEDVKPSYYQLDPLYLHCATGGDARRLTRGVARTGPQNRAAGIFFKETYKI